LDLSYPAIFIARSVGCVVTILVTSHFLAILITTALQSARYRLSKEISRFFDHCFALGTAQLEKLRASDADCLAASTIR
jgi:hypothetical protein